jgi:hypothetical protein
LKRGSKAAPVIPADDDELAARRHGDAPRSSYDRSAGRSKRSRSEAAAALPVLDEGRGDAQAQRPERFSGRRVRD